VIGLLAGAVAGYAFLPGSIEGSYGGKSVKCMCDSTNFMQYRDGTGILYASGHPPAGYYYRYETGSDGSVLIYSVPMRPEETETLAFRAYPRRLLTKFVDVDSGESEWLWKLRHSAELKEVVSTQEIVKTRWLDDERVARTFYSSDLVELRTEQTTRKELRQRSRKERDTRVSETDGST
jgi:hypothetical protein